jgi:hypothetical protein
VPDLLAASTFEVSGKVTMGGMKGTRLTMPKQC